MKLIKFKDANYVDKNHVTLESVKDIVIPVAAIISIERNRNDYDSFKDRAIINLKGGKRIRINHTSYKEVESIIAGALSGPDAR